MVGNNGFVKMFSNMLVNIPCSFQQKLAFLMTKLNTTRSWQQTRRNDNEETLTET